ncbi:MAG: hypothetical protein Kow0099_00970 [Candidatus Abyssubacteria bacterium]
MKTGVAYHDVRNLRYARQDLEDMVAHHCNMVIHTFSETDLSFYTRTMKDIVQISKDLGLEVYMDPWGVGAVFGGEALSRFIAENLDDRQVRSDGKSLPAACMNGPAFRSFMKVWVETAAETGAEVAFWDEPHFYAGDWTGGSSEKWACRCKHCQKQFAEQYGRRMPKKLTEEVKRFREKTVVDFFTELCDHAKRCGLKNALCVLPDEDVRRGVSDWKALASIHSLDIFGTDPYWAINGYPLEEYVREKTKRARALCDQNGLELQMWVQAFLIQDGREHEVVRATEILYEEGARNIAAWSYGGGGWMFTRSDNAEKVWENLGRVFGKLHGMEHPV